MWSIGILIRCLVTRVEGGNLHWNKLEKNIKILKNDFLWNTEQSFIPYILENTVRLH